MTRDTATQADIEHPIGATGRLSVKLSDWDVRLVAGSDDVVRVHDADGAGLPADLEIERGTDSLTIRQPSRFPGIDVVLGGDSSGRRLLIDVPAHAAVDITTASGDIDAIGLLGDQRFRTASGDLQLRTAGGDVATETISGDVAIRIDGSIALSVKTVSGDAAIEGGRIERLQLTTTSGDVRMTSDLGPGPHSVATVSGDATLRTSGGLRISALTVAGDLRSDLPHTSGGGPGRRTLLVGDGASELQFRSVSGDLRVVDPASPDNELLTAIPTPPDAPSPPMAPTPPMAPQAPDENEAARLEILRALEAGEIDVAEATDRLAGLDGSTDD
jgi:Putative adhesin